MCMRKLECANYKIIMIKTENLHGQNGIGMVKTELSWSNRIVVVKNRIAMVKRNCHGQNGQTESSWSKIAVIIDYAVIKITSLLRRPRGKRRLARACA